MGQNVSWLYSITETKQNNIKMFFFVYVMILKHFKSVKNRLTQLIMTHISDPLFHLNATLLNNLCFHNTEKETKFDDFLQINNS